MKTLRLDVTPQDAAILRDMIQDGAIALRTDREDDVVLKEDFFLKSNAISPGRKARYIAAMNYVRQLDDFVRLGSH